MRDLKLDNVMTNVFDDYIFISFSKKWLSLNNEKPIEFSVEVKEGKLVLSGSLERLDRTRSVITNDM